MKKKIDKKIIVILILIIFLIGIITIYILSNDSNSDLSTKGSWSQKTNANEDTKIIISKTGEITSTLEENLALHATYYFEKMYAEENEVIKKGEKIVKYTNDTYLLAPYDCIITDTNLPEVEGKCTNEHYIKVEASNQLSISITIDETQIEKIKIGQEAEISLTTLEKNYVGYITKISSTASNGKFTAIVEFENDGNLKIGMTGKCTITVI